jgi:acetyltransferase EpsM
MPIPLIILGAGGNSLSILDAVEEINRRSRTGVVYDFRGFLDDLPENASVKIHGYPVLGRIDQAREFSGCRFINGIASESSYTKKAEVNARSSVPDELFETIIHPSATISPSSRVGAGTAIMANSVICADAAVGRHVIILQNTVINHHSKVDDFSTLSAGIMVLGYVEIRRNAFIGGAAAIRPHTVVGEQALVGMASVVVKDVPDFATVAGNPARVMKSSKAKPVRL